MGYVTTLIKSPTFLLHIVSNIEKTIRRELTDTEENLVIDCIRKIPSNVSDSSTVDDIKKIIANTVLSELQLSHANNNEIDMHEMLKKNLGKNICVDFDECDNKDTSGNVEVNLESFFGIKDFASLVKKINEPVSSVNKAYFVLDTRYRILTNDGTKFFKWGHINNLVRAQGTVNSIGNVRDIISMKLSQFRMPSVKSAKTPYKRISILIHELEPQSFVAHEEMRYHFLGNIDEHNPAPGWMEIDPGENCGGEFKFNKSITHLDTITISLASPLEPVIFDPDRADGRITTYGNPTVIEFPNNHNLLDNDIVYISAHTSINSKFDSNVLSAINSKTGLVATYVSQTSITIPVDTSQLNFILVGTVSPAVASTIITGVGTNFSGELHVGDRITINDGDNNPSFIIKSIQSINELTITTPYTGSGGTVTKTNAVSDNISVYFGSKRIFFTLELTYLSS